MRSAGADLEGIDVIVALIYATPLAHATTRRHSTISGGNWILLCCRTQNRLARTSSIGAGDVHDYNQDVERKLHFTSCQSPIGAFTDSAESLRQYVFLGKLPSSNERSYRCMTGKHGGYCLLA